MKRLWRLFVGVIRLLRARGWLQIFNERRAMVSLVRFRASYFAVLTVALAMSTSLAVSDDSPPSFSAVRAIFVEKCLSCHGNDPKEIKGGYDLRTREAAIKGGESGDV